MKNCARNTMLFGIRILGVTAVACFLASPASAEALRLITAVDTPQSNGPTVPPTLNVCLDLRPAAGVQDTLTFSTPARAAIVIRLNAECSVGGAATNWLNTDIIIDPAGADLPFMALPSNSDNALCSGNGTATREDGKVSAITQAYGVVPAGTHTIRVCVNGSSASAHWLLDDLSLTIESEP